MNGYNIYYNNKFSDIIVLLLQEDSYSQSIDIGIFEKSQSNEGYPRIRFLYAKYNDENSGFTRGNIIYKTDDYNTEFIPYPGKLTEDLSQKLLQNQPFLGSDFNIFLSDNEPKIALSLDFKMEPYALIVYDPDEINPGGDYTISKFGDADNYINDHGYYYEVDSKILNEYDYKQYINNK